MGGDYASQLAKHGFYWKVMMGVKDDVGLKWTKGSTTPQADHWTCGYRSMCVALKVLHLMEEGSFKTDPPPFIPCTTADIESMRTEKAPAVYALKSGWLGYLPAGLFWKPEWKMDPDWDNNVSSFPENYPTEWYCPGHVKLLSSPPMNSIRMYERAPRRPQGGGRKDTNRRFLVIVKAEFADSSLPIRDEWIEDILYLQCRSSRHDEAMLTVGDFFNHGTPWLKDKKPRKATSAWEYVDILPDNTASLTPGERKVNYILNQSGLSNCCRCKRTASTQVSGRAKRKLQEEKQAELRARVVPTAPCMPAGPSTTAGLSTEASLHHGGKIWDETRQAHAPNILRVRDSTTSTIRQGAPGDEVFRTLVVGTEQLLDSNRMSIKLDPQDGLQHLQNFAQSMDREFWKDVGFQTSEARYRVRAAFHTSILSDSV
jgi:hypothetical protein